VVTVSAWSAREIARLVGIDRARIRIARQGVAPLDRPADPAVVAAMRARHGLAERYFVATAGGDPRKGEAFLRDVWQAWPEAPELVVAGAHARHVHGANGHAVQERVRALGYVPDEELRALYTGAVALLHPSRLEGFGRPPLEALACGTRVVAAPYGAAPEVLGETCDLLPPDVEVWRTHLAGLLGETCQARAERVDAGRRLAATYRWEDAASAVLDACREACGDAPPGASPGASPDGIGGTG
jgi:glycosyltransferase involved in cell wall biosynthesis